MTTLTSPFQQYGLIAELAKRITEHGGTLGKTALQKHVYFLQTLFVVDCGYDFSLYTYGPFSAELLGDLDRAAMFDAVDISPDPSTISGYQIKPGDKSERILAHASGFISSASAALEKLVADFGAFGAKELELRSTIVYAEREARMADETPNADHVVEVVRNLKPHFSKQQIVSALEELREKDYVIAA